MNSTAASTQINTNANEFDALERRRTGTRNIALSAVVMALAACIFQRFSRPLDLVFDCAQYLQAGQLLLAGKLPYVDFFDTNPPLFMYINMVPAYFARALGIHPALSFDLFIWLLMIGSTLACAIILFKREPAPDFALPLVLALSMMNLVLMQKLYFGQRDHVFVIGFLPYFIVRLCRQHSGKINPTTALLSGVAAGVAISLKPYFAVGPILLELYLCLKARSLRAVAVPEMAGCLLSIGLYAGHWFFVPKAMLHGFFDFVLPVVSAGYTAYNCPWQKVLFGAAISKALPLILLTGVLLRRQSSALVPLCLMCVGGYLSLVLQCKDYDYHYAPLVGFTVLLVTLEIESLYKFFVTGRASERVANAKIANVHLIAAVCVALLSFSACALIITKFCRSGLNPQSIAEPLQRPITLLVMKYTNPGEKVAFLDTGASDQQPLDIQIDRVYGTPYFFLFPIPMIEFLEKRTTKPAELAWLRSTYNKVVVQVCQELEQSRPKLIFIQDRDCWPYATNFSFYDHIRGWPRLQTVLDHYESLGQCGSYVAFKLVDSDPAAR